MFLVPILAGVSITSARAGGLAPPPHTSHPAQLSLKKGTASRPQSPTASCSYTAATDELLGRTSAADWMDWVRRLSGDLPVKFSEGETYTITTRFTPRLFDGSSNAQAYNYVLHQVQNWGYPAQSIEQDAWTSGVNSGMNLVLTIPGQITPTQVVALTAHLDSLSRPESNNTLAPGAEDNASGSAALLEAARLFRHYQFDRTVKIIWFTGEEQGLLGSRAYASDHSLNGYQGVINLDMFGYDNDGDRCIELHVGTLPASDILGQCFVDGISAYTINLSHDYLTSNYTNSSDHFPFWQRGVGAILVLENHFGNISGLGCGGVIDPNPNYHSVNDTVGNSFPPYTAGQPNTVGADIARAGLAAVAGLAGNRGACFTAKPDAAIHLADGAIQLTWGALPGASAYRVYRQVGAGPEVVVHQGFETSWTDTGWVPYWPNWYRVEAVAADGVCLSETSQRVGVMPAAEARWFFPVVVKN